MSELKSKEKLTWLGLKRAAQSLSQVNEEIERLKDTIGDFSTFQDHLENGYDWDGSGTKNSIDTYDDFRNYLEQGFGWSVLEVDKFFEKISSNFVDEDSSGSTFDDFKEYVIQTATSYQDLVNEFGSENVVGSKSETKDGGKAAGIKFYEESGMTKDGVEVPKGAAEIFGKEIHFSQTGSDSGSAIKDEEENTTDNFTVGNFQTDDADNVVDIRNPITFSADITNNSENSQIYVAALTEDGESIKSETLDMRSKETKTVNFTLRKYSYECHDYKIDTEGPIQACWKPSNFDTAP